MKLILKKIWTFLNYPFIAVMLGVFLLVCLLMLPTLGIRSTAGSTGNLFTCFSNFGGNVFESSVSFERLSRTPTWQPDAVTPPLPIEQAILLARKALDGIVAEPQVWYRNRVTIEVAGTHLSAFYVVEFRNSTKEALYPPAETVQIIVLMDGTVVETRPYKKA
jgi:hypothetical protein